MNYALPSTTAHCTYFLLCHSMSRNTIEWSSLSSEVERNMKTILESRGWGSVFGSKYLQRVSHTAPALMRVTHKSVAIFGERAQ